MTKLILLLYQKPGLNSKELAKELGVSNVTIKRDMQKLNKLVKFKGAPRTGGYFLIQEITERINRES
jgi:transcriptional antiterminator